MTFKVKSPEYLTALAEVRHAKENVAAAQLRLDTANHSNTWWTTEMIRLTKTGNPILTAQEIARRGDGSGVECLYYHRHADPHTAPFSTAELALFGDHVTEARERLDAAEAAVAEMVESGNYDLDPWEGNHRYMWWPLTNTAADWQGKPVTESDLARLSHEDLRRHIHLGSIRERTSVTV